MNDATMEQPGAAPAPMIRKYWPEISVFLLAAAVRLWDPGMTELLRYADRDAYRGWQFIHGLDWTPLGSELGYGRRAPGPFLYLFLGILLAVFKNPLALPVAAALGGTLAVFFSYKGCEALFGRKTALATAALLAVLPVHALNSRIPWNPTFGLPLASLAFWRLALSLRRAPSAFDLAAAFAALSAALQAHLSYALLLPAGFIALYRLKNRRKTAAALVGLFLPLAPYLGYEIKTGFANLRSNGPPLGVFVEVQAKEGSSLLGIEGRYVDLGTLYSLAGPPGFINPNALRLAGEHLAPTPDDSFQEFQRFGKAVYVLEWTSLRFFWIPLRYASLVLALALAAFGLACLLGRGEENHGAAFFVLAWAAAPFLPLLFHHFCYYTVAGAPPGEGRWVVGSRYLYPAFPALTVLVPLGAGFLARRWPSKLTAWARKFAVPLLCGAALIVDGAYFAADKITGRVGANNKLSLADKMALARALRCDLGLSMDDIGRRVADRSLFAIEDDTIYPLFWAGETCGRDASHLAPASSACYVLDVPPERNRYERGAPGRVGEQTLRGIGELTGLSPVPILRTEAFVISSYERETCLSGNVLNGYFTGKRDSTRPDGGRDHRLP